MQEQNEQPSAKPGDPADAARHGQQQAIDASLAGLDELAELPIAEHVGRFDAVHGALTNALASIDKV
ncbi:MAG: hypothetical protein J2O49_08715 [Sciscionella sp.]|nr:hypothetical protein [Sciscionella sp.]